MIGRTNPFLRQEPSTRELIEEIFRPQAPAPAPQEAPPQRSDDALMAHVFRQEPEQEEDEWNTWLTGYLTQQAKLLERFFRRGVTK